MISQVKISRKHFDAFRKECNRWMQRYGLSDWRVTFQHEDLYGQTWATCERNPESRLASLTLATWVVPGGSPVDAETISDTAHHEVLHILLAELTALVFRRSVQEEEIDGSEHAIVNRIIAATKEGTE